MNQVSPKGTFPSQGGVNKVYLFISSVASLEVMCLDAYLRKQEIGAVNSVIGRSRVAPTINLRAT